MKRLFFCAAFLGLMVNVFGQANFDAQDKEGIAKNKVKRQIQFSHDYVNGKPGSKGYKSGAKSFDKRGNLVEVIDYKADGSKISTIEYLYDVQGNKISCTRYRGDKEAVIYSMNARYDLSGCKLAESGIAGEANAGIIRFNNIFTYDSNRRLAEIKYTENNVLLERRVFKYSGNSLEMTILSPAGKVAGKETYILDGSKNVIENAKYIQNNIAQKAICGYDQNGKKTTEIKAQNGTFDSKTKYMFNQQGNITQISEETAGGKIFIAFQYKYDAKNNVVEEKWGTQGSSDLSRKSHKYEVRGLLTETEYYNSSAKNSSLLIFSYEFY